MKIGLDQFSKPAPLLYRRVLNALIIIVIPATGTLVMEMPEEVLSHEVKIYTGLAVSYVVALLKALEYIIGSDVNQEDK